MAEKVKKAVQDNAIKTPAKLQSFEDVQKALQDLAQQLNNLGLSTNSQAESETTDIQGKTGDIKITQNQDKTYSFEVRTEEEWKFPSVGESPVQLAGKKSAKSKPDATGVVDKYKDTFGNKVNMARPDFDSGWISVPSEDSGGNIEHNLDISPNSNPLINYVVYLRDTHDDTAAKWKLWGADGGMKTEGNDHFSVYYDTTKFYYWNDTDGANSLVKWASVGGNQVIEECDFRIFAWK
jgi:hypothetical protein